MDAYLEANKTYWERGYSAANVDHPVFRFYGRILNVDFKHLAKGRALDFGCGQGAAVEFFVRHGYDAVGVDISDKDIGIGRARWPHIADRLLMCDPDPKKVPYYGFDSDVSVVTGIQAFYYFTNTDFVACIEKIHNSMKRGGVFFASMMAAQGEFYENSMPVDDGLHRIEFKNDRISVTDYYISFVKDDAALKKKFSMFKCLHTGFYGCKLRNDEGPAHHLTFCGIKEN